MSPYQIVLADDHIMFRKSIRKILEERDDIEIVGEVSDGLELLNMLNNVVPDMVILDVSMPNMGGIEAAAEVKKIKPKVKVLILTMHMDKEFLYNSISAGAEGFLLKQDSDAELFSAIENIRKGRTYASSTISSPTDLARIRRVDRRFLSESLTTRERDVLKLIVDGKSNSDIAGVLHMSVQTAQGHRAKIVSKLRLKDNLSHGEMPLS